ncbi:MAG: twin-arginine translocase TatA/TatE family subunit [Coriobacteriia bacterium]|nr:twin-arginine translocase TatA/TatE family subunit [Coriobacteriia bacterium]
MSSLIIGIPAAGILGGIGVPELLIILVVILIIFGPKNLPKLGSALGRTVKGVREGLEGVDELDKGEFEEFEEDAPRTKKAAEKKSGE